jgi:hypothetical protein
MINQQIDMLEKVVSILELIPETFVFTGGATIGLYVDEVVKADLRPTDDVDCVVEITTKGKYYQLTEQLRKLGLEESTKLNAPLCRWQYQEINIDIMPSHEKILGFSNRWYAPAIYSVISYQLPSNRIIKIFSTPYLLASKIEAFLGRGKGSFYWSTDIEDIITLLDGCSSLEIEVKNAEEEVKNFIQKWFKKELENLEEIIPATLSPVAVNSGRVQLLSSLIQRLASL